MPLRLPRDLGEPGQEESASRAHGVDSTAAKKIQGPEPAKQPRPEHALDLALQELGAPRCPTRLQGLEPTDPAA